MNPGDPEVLTAYFAASNPNPARLGCPSREVLSQIATGNMSLASPWYDHLAMCSECFQEVRHLKRRTERNRGGRWRWAWIGIAAAFALVIAAAIPRAMRKVDGPTPTPEPIVSAPLPHREIPSKKPQPVEPIRPRKTAIRAATAVSLDLAPLAMVRATKGPAAGAIRLPAERLTATISLPIASEPGGYEFELRDSNQRTVAKAAAQVSENDGRAIARVNLDARLPRGSYQLAVRFESEDWRLYPVEIR